ncbi:hypothetical protein B0919_08170 [Hymenobacter sp. CRA2]|nr:hypothetical protein B0919_08170 [Hymenobacter sp. CRA2]
MLAPTPGLQAHTVTSYGGTGRAMVPAAAQAFLARHDLKTLWLPVKAEGEWGGYEGPEPVQNGFFGADHYRIEFALLSVVRDAKQPQLYHVKGKNRYKGRITPFSGTITITKVYQNPPAKDVNDQPVPQYTVVGPFELREDATTPGSGTFKGTVAADVTVWNDGRVELDVQPNTAAANCGYKFSGQWVSARTGQVKPVLWGDNLNAVSRQLFSDFMVGERMPHVNPKYAKLGWNRIWDNDEWWAETPANATAL